MASFSSLPDDDDPSHPDSASSFQSSVKRRLSYRPPVPPKDSNHLSLSDLHNLPRQRPPASPRFHQRNFTYDHYEPSTFPSPRFASDYAAAHDHSGSIDTALKIGYHPQSFVSDPASDQVSDRAVSVRDLDLYPRGHPAYSRSPSRRREDDEYYDDLTPEVPDFPASNRQSETSNYERHSCHSHHVSESCDPYDPQPADPRDSFSEYDDYDGQIGEAVQYQNPAMPSTKPTDLRVDVNPPERSPGFPQRSTSIKRGVKKLLNPKSPSIKSPDVGKTPETGKSPEKNSFWSWGKPRQNSNMESPSTQFSEGTPMAAEQHHVPRTVSPLEEHQEDDNYFGSELDGYSQRSSSPNPYNVQGVTTNVTELLQELQVVSAELAASIRREMELEDQIDQFQTDMPNPPVHELSRRTSDYYSDSGASSTKLPGADADLKLQGLEKMRRKAEQEKAQLRIDMAQKVQEDLNQRRALEMHVSSLEEQLQAADSSQSLEAQLEDYRRRLNDEKESKANFDHLLIGMREEIEAMRNDRDNLRDEVVPQLRAQLQGMETETSEAQNLAYENTRMQQELQNLKNENQTLQNARRLQSGFRTISEEGETSPASPTLSRSNSLARSRSTRARSGSLMERNEPNAPAESLPDRVKHVEEQRDALHRTVKSLIMRQEQLSRKHTKKITALETERDRALAGTPRRQGFHIKVQHLRSEINSLRQRADDALEQKMQCENGLYGLRMDLDRAQQETSSLRELLEEHSIPAPASVSHSPSHSNSSTDSLDRAFGELRRANADSLAASGNNADVADATEARLQSLAAEVQQQQASNKELHARLAKAIHRGETDQTASAHKINELQAALRAAEERVMAAQTASEDAIADQESTAKDVKDSLTAKDRRITGLNRHAQPAPSALSLSLSPSLESAVSLFSPRSPNLQKTSSGKGESMKDNAKTIALERRIKELEEAAVGAEEEMQGVVEQMNKAQIEVAELQMQRDEAEKGREGFSRDIWAERERGGR